MRPHASGRQYEIAADGYVAVVTEVGASLRLLRHEGRDLVVPFSADEIRPLYRGAVLAPWPNRVAHGRYTFDGAAHQLPVNEVDRMNALHGLVSWAPWRLVEQSERHVVLAHRLHPVDGYPFLLDLEVSYRLGPDGLDWEIAAVNTGPRPLPYGCAHHPYLVAGAGGVDDWTLHVPAERYLDVTPDRLLPRGVTDVAGTELDFRSPRGIGPTFVDHAYTGLARDEHGLAAVSLTDATGRGVLMSWGTAWPWVQVHTADRPEPEMNRIGLAVEPMTCPPDAFNSGTDLIVLAPDGEHRAAWNLCATAGPDTASA